MPWGKVDDTHYDHRKVDALDELEGSPPTTWKVVGDGVFWLVISWCNRHLTDGHVSARQVAKVTGLTIDEARLVADALVAVNLWDRDAGEPDAYLVHDFAEYNKLKVDVLRERAMKADAGRLGGMKRAEQLRGEAEAVARARQSGSTVLAESLAQSRHGAKHGASESEAPSQAKRKHGAKQNASTRGSAPVPSRPVQNPIPLPTLPVRSGSSDPIEETFLAERIATYRARLADASSSEDIRSAARDWLNRLGVPLEADATSEASNGHASVQDDVSVWDDPEPVGATT